MNRSPARRIKRSGGRITLADGSVTTQPEFSFWFNDVGWGVENYGTDPTIEVEYLPQAYVAGQDPQLERAIAEAVKLVEERPAPTPTPGPRPERGFSSNGHIPQGEQVEAPIQAYTAGTAASDNV